jgi:hypothetical protein
MRASRQPKSRRLDLRSVLDSGPPPSVLTLMEGGGVWNGISF